MEVTIALGLTIFAVMTVVGLLPVGLVGMRQAAEDTVKTQILKEVDARLCMADSKDLFAQSPETSAPIELWFGNEGQLLGANDESARFRVVVTQGMPQFPGSANANAAATSLRAFLIGIQDVRTQATSQAVLHVANNGH